MARYKKGYYQTAKADTTYWCQLIKFWSKNINPKGRKPLSDGNINYLLTDDSKKDIDQDRQPDFYRWRTGKRSLDSAELHNLLALARKRGLLPPNLEVANRDGFKKSDTAAETLRTAISDTHRVERLSFKTVDIDNATDAIRDLREQIEDLRPRLSAYYKSIKILEDLGAEFYYVDEANRCIPRMNPNFLFIPDLCDLPALERRVDLSLVSSEQSMHKHPLESGAKVVHQSYKSKKRSIK